MKKIFLNKFYVIIIILFIIQVLISCTTPISQLRLSEDRFTLSYLGATNEKESDIEKKVLIAASTITIENGFTFFIITRKDFSNKIIAIPNYSGGTFVGNRPNIYIEIKCLKNDIPEAINAQEFLTYNN